MKNTILMIAILIISFVNLGNAQEPLSFRSNALGGVIDDDLDLVYDPIELRFVDGIRLYTNLSNLTSTQEQLFANDSDNEFLLGMSYKIPLMIIWQSVMVRFQNSETSNSVGIDSNLDGYNDITGNGTLIDTYTAYIDTDYDGFYDFKHIFSQEKSDFSTDNSYSFILNNTLNLFGLTMGAKLSTGDATYTGNSASSYLGSGKGVLNDIEWNEPTFHNSVITHLIDDEYNNMIWTEDGDFSSENKVSFTNIDASLMLPEFRGFELRGDASIYSTQILSNLDDTYIGEYEYFDPDEISNYTDTYSESDAYISETDRNGIGMKLGGSLRKTFNKQDDRKNDGFWKVGLSLEFISYDYINSSSSQFSSIEASFDGELSSNDFEKIISEETSASDVGTDKLSSYNLYCKFNIPLAKYVHFGLGGHFNQSSRNRVTDYIELQNNITDYDYTASDYYESDYVSTETSQLTADKNYNVYITTFTYPIGLEYKIGNKRDWSLRFGSIFTNTSQTINDAKQITDSEPFVLETEYGDGDVTIVIDSNAYNSTSEQIRTISSSTIFTYGLGHKPTENLQIDLLGFLGTSDNSLLDASFYRNLRLSFTMRF
jgi:hypothetical protein